MLAHHRQVQSLPVTEAWSPAIAFDARDLLIAQRTGVEGVAWQMLDNLPAQLPGVRLALVLDRPDTAGLLSALAQRGRFELLVLPPRWPRLQRAVDGWMAWQIGPQLKAAGFDLLVSVNTKIPLRGLPAMATVHGVEWAMVPGDYPLLERLKQRGWLYLAAWRARGLLTFSHTTRSDLGRLLPGLKCPIAVIAEGVMPHLRPLPPAAIDRSVPGRLGIHRPFALSVCTLAPRKNIDGLLHAWAGLKQRRRERGEPLPQALVLVGRDGAASAALRRQAQRLGLAADVVFTGYVDDPTLLQLYHQADVFAYPSRYEGFGLPPLEAMRCGAPVLTSQRSATAEVAGGAALLVDPDDVDAMAVGLDRLLGDPGLRRVLAALGRQHAAGFTWPAFAARCAPFLLSLLAPAAVRPLAAGAH